jgi:AcrR family transcriptional regulator
MGAAKEMFVTRGYAQTTIPAVAAQAGVSIETVYKAFGTKAGLAKAVFDVAVVGDDGPVPWTRARYGRWTGHQLVAALL